MFSLSPEFKVIRIWECDRFRLFLWNTQTRDSYERVRLHYLLEDDYKIIFYGTGYCCSPSHAPDSDLSVADLLDFLTLRPGDTDREYFKDYTPLQMEWCKSSRADELRCIVQDMKDR